jgi:hypothetical protein
LLNEAAIYSNQPERQHKRKKCERDIGPAVIPLARQQTSRQAAYCTVSVSEDVTPPEFPPITAVPDPWAVANPATLGAFAMVATVAEDELQCVVNVMSWVVPSLKLPVAANCCVPPTAAVGLTGAMASETNVPVPTVSVVVPVTPDAVAEMVTEPLFFPCTTPELRMDAIFGFEDFHVRPLRFVAVLPSLKFPVAVNLSNVPLAILGFAGLIVIDTKWAVETVN